MTQEGEKGTGALFVVATPLGNLADLPPRALETLAQADLIAAEDTRRTRGLLTHFGLSRPLLSCHKFNEAVTVSGLLDRVAAGLRVALVTDGGTPAVSDPGYRLVAEAHARGLPVAAIAGPSAVTTALSVAGFPADRFFFGGFLPPRSPARRKALARFAALEETVVFFEAPHRLLLALGDLLTVLGDRPAAVCRELTKLHEEVRRASLSGLAEEFGKRESIRGEIVLVVAGAAPGTAPPPPSPPSDLLRAFRAALKMEQGDPRRALKRLARETRLPRQDLKRRLGLS